MSGPEADQFLRKVQQAATGHPWYSHAKPVVNIYAYFCLGLYAFQACNVRARVRLQQFHQILSLSAVLSRASIASKRLNQSSNYKRYVVFRILVFGKSLFTFQWDQFKCRCPVVCVYSAIFDYLAIYRKVIQNGGTIDVLLTLECQQKVLFVRLSSTFSKTLKYVYPMYFAATRYCLTVNVCPVCTCACVSFLKYRHKYLNPSDQCFKKLKLTRKPKGEIINHQVTIMN